MTDTLTKDILRESDPGQAGGSTPSVPDAPHEAYCIDVVTTVQGYKTVQVTDQYGVTHILTVSTGPVSVVTHQCFPGSG